MRYFILFFLLIGTIPFNGQTPSFSYLPISIPDRKNGRFKEIFCPYIPIRISTNQSNQSFPFDALVDSGSDRNIFPALIAEYIGIDLKRLKSYFMYGIGNSKILVYPAKITLWVGTNKFNTEADFSYEQDTPLLGRQGFFNLFKSITFKDSERFVYLEL